MSFNIKYTNGLILFIQLRIRTILKHLDTRCCKLGFICPLWTINRAKQNAAQRGGLVIL